MTHRSIRLACAAGLAAVAMLPGGAGAHPVDCEDGMTAAPTGGWPADWAPEGCADVGASATQSTFASTTAGPAVRGAERSRRALPKSDVIASGQIGRAHV